MPMAAKQIAPMDEVPMEEALVEEQHAAPVEDQAVSAEEPAGAVEDEVTEAEIVEAEVVESGTVESEVIESEVIEAESVEAEVIESGTVESVEIVAAAVESDAAAVEQDVAVAEDHAATGAEQVGAVEAETAEGASASEPVARPEELRLLEALLFASSEPLDEPSLAKRMPEGVDVKAALAQLQADYAMRGVNLVRVASKWTFRTAGDLAWLMTRESVETRRLSRAAIETLAIIAYHQPVTRAEIEEIRGVVTSKGTLDVLLETGWIRPRGRRKTPGRPLTFGTTEAFLSQFSLEALGDLPGLEELKGAGLLDTRLPSGFAVPSPSDDPALREDEDPLEPGDLDLALAPAVEPEKPGES